MIEVDPHQLTKVLAIFRRALRYYRVDLDDVQIHVRGYDAAMRLIEQLGKETPWSAVVYLDDHRSDPRIPERCIAKYLGISFIAADDEAWAAAKHGPAPCPFVHPRDIVRLA